MVRQYAAKGRFKPQHTTLGGIAFDSAFEANVYKALLSIPYYDVERQFAITYKPQTKRFKALSWRCDFRIETKISNPGGSLFVEAKGAVTKDFLDTMIHLEYVHSLIFQRLLIVIPDSFPTNERGLKAIKTLERHHLRWCTLSDVRDTVMTRLGLPNM